MVDTPNLKLPYILAAQAQKHVTHNEAIRALDALVQLAVKDKDLATPPAMPADGDRYIIAAAATGAWAGHTSKIAAWQDGAWTIYPAAAGWRAWIVDQSALYAFDGAAWIAAGGGGGGSVNPTPLVGVNTTADATNRLAVAAPASLFNHQGAGHQQKINKAAAANTASQLYQTGFSGRAEIGLTGDDNFHFKVSADGAVWRESILLDRNTGRVSFPSGGAREVLTANRSYFVRTDGNDANTGLSNTAGAAFLTIQKALDVVGALDLSTFLATIWINDGTYVITAPLGYRGYQGGQVTLRALNYPLSSPEFTTLTGTRATDEAAVRASHKVVVEASTATSLMSHVGVGGISNVRGIAFIQNGAHTTALEQQYSSPAVGFTQCSFIGGGTPVKSQSRATYNNCLLAYSAGSGLSLLAAANVYANASVFAYATGNQLSVLDGSSLQAYGGRAVSGNTATPIYADRSSNAYVSGVSIEGGVNSFSLGQADATPGRLLVHRPDHARRVRQQRRAAGDLRRHHRQRRHHDLRRAPRQHPRGHRTDRRAHLLARARHHRQQRGVHLVIQPGHAPFGTCGSTSAGEKKIVELVDHGVALDDLGPPVADVLGLRVVQGGSRRRPPIGRVVAEGFEILPVGLRDDGGRFPRVILVPVGMQRAIESQRWRCRAVPGLREMRI